MRRYRLRDVMAVIAIIATSMALGGYLEGLRRDAAEAGRGTGTNPVSASRPTAAARTGPFNHLISGFW